MSRFFDKLQQLTKIAVLCHRLAPIYSRNYFAVFSNAVRMCRIGKFQPEEAFRFGLFKPDFPRHELPKYISRRNLTKAQEAVNPVSWEPVLKNKGVFYRYCMAIGVPIPKLYAIFFRETAGWSYNGNYLISRNNWINFLNTQLPEEFVIKPARGAGGRKLNIFHKTKAGFIDVFKKAYKAEQLYELMLSDTDCESFIIQERLTSHPEIERLSGTDFLQTVRFITFVDVDNQCHIMLAYLKPIIDENVIIDNFQVGLGGNVEARVSLDGGLLEPAKQITPDGSGVATLQTHPKTGISFNGFQLPMWEQTSNLVKEASLKLLPVRAIGWDVAITRNGPLIVEGNIWWDPCNEHLCMDTIVNALSSAAKNLTC